MPKPTQSKIALVQAMLAKPRGASLVAICKATGWQAHSARAAFSRLRKAGHVIERTQAGGKTSGSVYRTVSNPDLIQ